MSNPQEREAEDRYEAENDASPIPKTPEPDTSYVGETRREVADINPVQADNVGYDDPMQPPYSNSDEQLGM